MRWRSSESFVLNSSTSNSSDNRTFKWSSHPWFQPCVLLKGKQTFWEFSVSQRTKCPSHSTAESSLPLPWTGITKLSNSKTASCYSPLMSPNSSVILAVVYHSFPRMKMADSRNPRCSIWFEVLWCPMSFWHSIHQRWTKYSRLENFRRTFRILLHWISANSFAAAFVPYLCKVEGQYLCGWLSCGAFSGGDRYSGVCDEDGCDFNVWRMGNKTFFEPSGTGDRKQLFQVITQFMTNDGKDSGGVDRNP